MKHCFPVSGNQYYRYIPANRSIFNYGALTVYDKFCQMNEQVTHMLSSAIRAKLAEGPRFRFDGSIEDAFDRVVYLDDFIPVALEEFAGLYEKIMRDDQSLSTEEIDIELVSLVKEQLQLV